MKAKVLEIFQSIQGEGKYTGVKQVFVRFFECNMHCVWCDTPHSIGDTTRRFNEMPVDEVFREVVKLKKGCHSVSLTGGEPLLQADAVKSLAKRIKKEGLLVYLETNGILPDALNEVIGDVDIVAMDVKLPSSAKCQAFWAEHAEFLKIASSKDVFIKTVITSDTDVKDIKKAIDMVGKINPEIIFILQPNYFEMKNGVMKKCLEFEEICSSRLFNVRIIPQVHKFLKLR